jgi:hypothetical protein
MEGNTMKKLLLLVVVAALVAIPAASAAKPVHAAQVKQTISVSPVAPVVGDQVIVSGCGFVPQDATFSEGIYVQIEDSSSTVVFSASTDAGANGCFATGGEYQTFVPTVAGTYSVLVIQGQSHSVRTSFTVS